MWISKLRVTVNIGGPLVLHSLASLRLCCSETDYISQREIEKFDDRTEL